MQATNFVIGYKTKTNNLLYLQTNDLKNNQYVEYYSHSYDMHHIGHLPYKKKIETMTTNEIKRDFEKNKRPCSDFITGNGHASLNWLCLLD